MVMIPYSTFKWTPRIIMLNSKADYIGNKDRGENVGDPCPVAEGTLYQRDDDKEDTVRNRLKVFKEQTSPIIDFYQDKGILQRLVGGNDPKLLSNKIIEILDK